MGHHDSAAGLAVAERSSLSTDSGCAGRRGWSALARGVRAAIFATPDWLGEFASAGTLDAHTLADIGLAADPFPDTVPSGLWLAPAWQHHLAATGLRLAPTDSEA